MNDVGDELYVVVSPELRTGIGSHMVQARIGLGFSIILFAIPALLLWIATTHAVPALAAREWHPLLAWFAAGGLLVFAPLLAAAVMATRRAAPGTSLSALLEHLRVRRLSGKDWTVGFLVLAATLVAMAVLHLGNAHVWPQLPPHPPFMSVEPLAQAQLYILALWLPFFAANIVGEELWWRGYIQPRQENVFGTQTWLLQGILHAAFHFSFGLGLIFILWPAFFAIPWAVQRTKNTSVGMLVHAGINGLGFLAVTLGWLPT